MSKILLLLSKDKLNKIKNILIANLIPLSLNKWGSLVIKSFVSIDDKVIINDFVHEIFSDKKPKNGEEDYILTLMQNEYSNFVPYYIYNNVDTETQKIIAKKLRML